MALKTDYKDDSYEGKRKYLLIDNGDGTYSLDDVTVYKVIGDFFNSYDINETNTAVNENSKGLIAERDITNQQVKELNKKQIALEGDLTKVLKLTFSADGWTSSAPYEQLVEVREMKDTYNPIPGLVYPSEMTQEEKENIDKSSDMITELETLDGFVKATCKFKKPVADIVIGLKGR